MTRARVTKDLARTIATLTEFNPGVVWADVRDHCDLWTGSDLDTFQLDLLTDWVWKLIRKESSQ